MMITDFETFFEREAGAGGETVAAHQREAMAGNGVQWTRLGQQYFAAPNAARVVVNSAMCRAKNIHCTALSRRYDVLILCARVDFTP